jgi:hypothetical protein
LSQRLSRFGNHASDTEIAQRIHREILFRAADAKVVLVRQSSAWRKTRFPHPDHVSPHGFFINTPAQSGEHSKSQSFVASDTPNDTQAMPLVMAQVIPRLRARLTNPS